MGNFQGGSAYGMASQISEGYILVNERTFHRLQRGELDKLTFELEKRLREIRGEQPDLADTKAVQQRQRKMMRINSATMMLRAYRMKRKM